MNDIERKLKDLGERAAREVSYGEVPARKIVRRARLRRSLTVAVPALAAVLLAAVAYPGLARLTRDGDGRDADLAFAAAATKEAGSARALVEMEMTIPGRTITATATGEIDFERARSHLVLEQEDPSGSNRLEMISIGDRMFQRPLREGETSKWVARDIPWGATAFGVGSGPADLLGALETMDGDVTEVGDEELDGVRVTHYQAVVDPAGLGEFPDSEIDLDPMHVWVDELGRLRKMTFGSTFTGGPGGEGSTRMTLVLSDFGVPVYIAAPDPEDVTDDVEPLEPDDSGSAAGEHSFSDFSSDTQLVFGDGFLREPFLTVNIDDVGTSLLCVQGGPADATSAILTHEASGRRIATFALHDGGKKPGVACAPPGIAHEDVDALLSEPSEYTLRIELDRGPDVVVPLAETGAPISEE